MGLIKFLTSRKQEKSVLASKIYGKEKVEVKLNDKSILAIRKYGQEMNEQNKNI